MVVFRVDQYVAPKVGNYNKTGAVPRPKPQAVTENDAVGWTDVHMKSAMGKGLLPPACIYRVAQKSKPLSGIIIKSY